MNARDKNKDRDVLCARLQHAGYRVGAEIGVQFGDHAGEILARVACTLWCIDSWAIGGRRKKQRFSPDEIYAFAAGRLSKFGERAKLLRVASVEAAAQFGHNSLDFVYIDADHSAAAVAADLEAWYPVVRYGGMICGHDYVNCGDRCWVKEPVDAFFGGKHEVYHTPDSEWPEWWVFKDGN